MTHWKCPLHTNSRSVQASNQRQDFVVVVMPYESSSDAKAAKSQHAAQRRQTENAILCTWQGSGQAIGSRYYSLHNI